MICKFAFQLKVDHQQMFIFSYACTMFFAHVTLITLIHELDLDVLTM